MALAYPSARAITLILGSSLTVLALVGLARSRSDAISARVIPSPRETLLRRLSKEEQDELPYPPDLMPGGRDVRSAYGTIRVNEWGPSDGRRVILIHGISTPSLALHSLANHLVGKNCRVMLFDLFGRGYSDSPDLPHDRRLWTTQILLAITSSPISWTPDGFSMIGYSLGGGICADFAADFPNLVKGLVLLAPSGLIRSSHFSRSSRLLYTDYVPESWRHWVIRRRLGATPARPARQSGDEENPTTSEEMKGNRDPDFDNAVLRPGVSVGMAMDWQLRYHEGYLRSFISSIRYSSIAGADETWSELSKKEEMTLVLAGSEDAVIIADELEEDARLYIGEKMEFKVVQGGHDFPIRSPEEVAGVIISFWKL